MFRALSRWPCDTREQRRRSALGFRRSRPRVGSPGTMPGRMQTWPSTASFQPFKYSLAVSYSTSGSSESSAGMPSRAAKAASNRCSAIAQRAIASPASLATVKSVRSVDSRRSRAWAHWPNEASTTASSVGARGSEEAAKRCFAAVYSPEPKCRRPSSKGLSAIAGSPAESRHASPAATVSWPLVAGIVHHQVQLAKAVAAAVFQVPEGQHWRVSRCEPADGLEPLGCAYADQAQASGLLDVPEQPSLCLCVPCGCCSCAESQNDDWQFKRCLAKHCRTSLHCGDYSVVARAVAGRSTESL